MVEVVRPKAVAGLELVEAPAEELGFEPGAYPRVLAPPARAFLDPIPLVGVEVEDVHRPGSLRAEAAEREVHRRPFGQSDGLLGVGKLSEHPSREDLLEASVYEPARQPSVEVPPKGSLGLAFLDHALDDRKRLPHVLDLGLELVAPSNLSHHHRYERGIVAPRAQEDLREPLELLLGRLLGVSHGAEAAEKLAPVLDEDRSQHLVLRCEVVVEKTVSNSRVLSDVTHTGTVVAAICEDTNGGVQDELPLLEMGD